MKINLKLDRTGHAYVGLWLSVQRHWPERHYSGPSWKHYSVGFVSPVTYYKGWRFWPLRFGIFHGWQRFHLYLGLVYISVDIATTGSRDHFSAHRVGPLSLVWQR